jgi:hypothetical protein
MPMMAAQAVRQLNWASLRYLVFEHAACGSEKMSVKEQTVERKPSGRSRDLVVWQK